MSDIERVFIRFRGRTIGPLTPEKVQDMVRRGQVTRMHELSGDGLSWMKADEFGNFFPPAGASMSSGAEMADSAAAVPPGSAGGGGGSALVNENATAQWYAHVNGEKEGPVSMDQMRLYAEAKILKKDSLVWRNGMESWKPASETLPELFGGGSKTNEDAGQPDEEAGSEGTALGRELVSRHPFILAMGICLVLLGAGILVGQIFTLTQPGGLNLKSEKLAAAVHICLGLTLLLPGILAIPAANRLKAASESSSAIDMLLAARAISQFWAIGGIAIIAGTVLLLLIAIAAVATGVPVTNVFF